MALRFFWRCEGTSLATPNDYPDGMTATIVAGFTIDNTNPKVGSNSLSMNGSNARVTLPITSEDIFPIARGCIGLWIYVGAFNDHFEFLRAYNSAAVNDHYALSMRGTDDATGRELRFFQRQNGNSADDILTTGADFEENAWYFVVLRWDTNLRRIELYDTDGVVIQNLDGSNPYRESTASYLQPNELDTFQIGTGVGASNISPYFIDHIMIDDDPDAPIQDFMFTESASEYGASSDYPIIVDSSSSSGDDVEGSITLPAGIQAGDRILICLSGAAGAGSVDLNETINDGGFSWSTIGASAGFPDIFNTLYTKTADGSESSDVITFEFMSSTPSPTQLQYNLIAVVFRNALAFNFSNSQISDEVNADNNHTCDSVTTDSDMSLYVVLWGLDDGDNTGIITPDALQTEIEQISGTGLGAARSMIDYSERPDAGATGTRTITCENNTNAKCAVAFEIRSAGSFDSGTPFKIRQFANGDFQAVEFIEVNDGHAMRMYANGVVQVTSVEIVAGVPKLYANGTYSCPQFIEVL